jgi:uncharacterized SAM-binding protein YcdF (DUF218 family)
MMSQAQHVAASGALGAAEPVGWSWPTPPLPAAPPDPVPLSHQLRGAAVKSAGWLAGSGAVVAVLGFLCFVSSIDRFERQPDVRADGIVALTGGSQRIGDAIDLLAQGYGSRLLITGVNDRTSRDEIARLNPGQRRLFECCVDFDYRARNTIGNAVETRRWVQDHRFRSLIVVTSNYHMPRTLLELEHVLPSARLIPYAVVSATIDPKDWWRSATTARVLASEYAKLLVVWVRTRFETVAEPAAEPGG